MLVLIALLWCVYLSDCFVRMPRDSWMFRAGALKPARGVAEPTLLLAGGAVDLAWTPVLPWQSAYLVSGTRFDVEAARERLSAVQRHSRWSKIASGLLFTWVMGVLSALILTDRFLHVMLPWAIVAAIVHVTAFVLFVISYRRVHDTRPPLETWLTLALSPVSLMRAPVVVAVGAVTELHPVAVAAIVCDDAEFLGIARVWYFDAPEARGKIEAAARTRDLDQRLLAGPDNREPGVSQYCPRCHGTYRAAARQCSDCDNVSLKALEV